MPKNNVPLTAQNGSGVMQCTENDEQYAPAATAVEPNTVKIATSNATYQSGAAVAPVTFSFFTPTPPSLRYNVCLCGAEALIRYRLQEY
jgi:hypothetical protein